MGGELMDWFRRLFGVPSPSETTTQQVIRIGLTFGPASPEFREAFARFSEVMTRKEAADRRPLDDWENEGGACYTGSSQPKEEPDGRTEVP